jgi:CRISPR-associated protein Cas2
MLSGYRIMWMMVMFDLPVVLKEERQAATAFRLSLLDMGFEMSQLSVYMRCCTSIAQIETYGKRVEHALPEGGKVHVMQMTDRQFERIVTFRGRAKQPHGKAPDQFALF